MIFIYNETLSGVVNGVNTTFTTLNDIEKIEEVYLGGAPYRNVTFVGNTVTFAVAPPLGASSPTIDYFIEDVTIPDVTTDVTYGSIIDEVYDIMGVTRSSDVYLEGLVKKHIDRNINSLKNIRYPRESIQSYSFNKAKDGTVGAYNANYVDIGTKDYIPSSGVYMLKDSILKNYSSYSSGRLNGTVGVVYKKGDSIIVGYSLPSNIKKVNEVIIDGVALEPRDIRDYTINDSYYCIYQASVGVRYLFLPFTSEDKLVTVTFTPQYLDIDADTDLVDIDKDYSDVPALYSAYQVLMIRDDERWIAIKREYLERKRDYLSFKARATGNINNQFRTSDLQNV